MKTESCLLGLTVFLCVKWLYRDLCHLGHFNHFMFLFVFEVDVLVLTDGCFLSVILFYHPISCAQNRLWKLLGIVRA